MKESDLLIYAEHGTKCNDCSEVEERKSEMAYDSKL